MEARHLGSCGKPCRFGAIHLHQEISAKGIDCSLVGGPTTTPWQLKLCACRPRPSFECEYRVTVVLLGREMYYRQELNRTARNG